MSESWCECCYRNGPTTKGAYLAPEVVDGRTRLKIRRGQFCRSCHVELARRSFVKLAQAFAFTFPGFIIFPFGLSMLFSVVRRWVDLIPISYPPEPLVKLVTDYRNVLKGQWNRIYMLARNGVPVPAVVTDIYRRSELPPRAIYAALRFLESTGRKQVLR